MNHGGDKAMARILLTEDDESVRAFVKRALELDGHDVTAAEDGGMALEILQERRGDFDLLLSDIMMPVMDGIALALATARSWPDLTILLMTGFADQRERAHGLDALVHDVVAKPFTLSEIRRAVANALAATAPGAALKSA
jgi:two-component system, cell cycle response regulator CpdR